MIGIVLAKFCEVGSSMAIDRRKIDYIVRDLRAVATDTQDIEVKESVLRLPASMAETVSAFANGPGGTIILGVSEKNGFTVAPGFRAKPTADSLATICSDKLTPPIRPEIDIVDFEGAQLVVAHIHELPPLEKPCYITERGVYQGSYVRVSDGDRKLSTYEIDRLLEERSQPAFDLDVVAQASRSDLDHDLLDAVLARQRTLHPKVFAERSDDKVLSMLHVLGKDDAGTLRPTLAGLLALGIYPQQFFPRLTVVFTAYPTRTEGGLPTFVDAETMAGPIPTLLADTLAAVQRNIRCPEQPEYPLAAVCEAVANALIHRDYSPLARATAVEVSLYDDRLEVVSPGGLYGTVTSESLGTPGYSSARNQYLLSLLENVPFSGGYIAKNRNGGYQLICDEMSRAGMSRPKAEDFISSFMVTLYATKETSDRKLPDDEILAFLLTAGEASAAEIAETLGLSKRTVAYRLNNFIDQGFVVRIGKPRSPRQRYRLA